MAASDILTIVDEVITTILALNPPTYFAERDAAKHEWTRPRGGHTAYGTATPSHVNRLFWVLPSTPQLAEWMQGPDADVGGAFTVRIRYLVPPTDGLAEEHAYRMSARDGEVVQLALRNKTWSALQVGRVMLLGSTELQLIDEGHGLYEIEHVFQVDYNYDGN